MTDIRTDRSRTDIAATVSSVAEAGLGLGAAVLAIVGLAGASSVLMGQVAALVLGLALLLEAGALAGHFVGVRDRMGEERRTVVEGGVGAELVGGLAATVLAFLSLVGVGSPAVLIPAAAVVLGAALLLGGGAMPWPLVPKPGRTAPAATPEPEAEGVVVESDSPEGRRARTVETWVNGAGGLGSSLGIATVILGILALLGMSPATFTLFALLSAGVALAVGGVALVLRFNKEPLTLR